MRARLLAAALVALLAPACLAGPCATSLEDLRRIAGDPAFPLRWVETTMTDGKPMVVSILEQDGSLFLRFRKTGEGLWAEGAALVCAVDRDLQARISRSRLQIGPAAHWIFRLSAPEGARFTLTRQASGLMRVATPGWSGSFAAVSELSAVAPDAAGEGVGAASR
jgi:hypothetical protein